MNKQDLNKNQEFKVPKDYFENFETALHDRMDQESNLAFLDVKKDNNAGFKVPNDYFENLEDHIVQEIDSKRKASKIITFRPWHKIGAVASIAALFVLVFSIARQSTENVANTTTPIALSTLENYILNNDMDYSMNELEDVLDMEDVMLADTYSSTIETDAIYDYLDENIDNELFLTD